MQCKLAIASLGRHPPNAQVVLGRHTESVRHPIKERKHRGDIYGFRNLVLAPTGVAEFLHILVCGSRGGSSDQFNVVQ